MNRLVMAIIFLEAIQIPGLHNPDELITVQNVAGALLCCVLWFLRGKIALYDRHLIECTQKDVARGQEYIKVHMLERKMDRTISTVNWVGDCVQRMSAKMQIEIPDRPDRFPE